MEARAEFDKPPRWLWWVIPTLILGGFQARVVANRVETEREVMRLFREVTAGYDHVDILHHGVEESLMDTTTGLYEMHWFAVTTLHQPTPPKHFERGQYVVRVGKAFPMDLPGRRITWQAEDVTVILISRERNSPWWYWPKWLD